MNHKINNIQALRAFAAMSVVVFHTGYVVPFMHPFGSFGVGVFFVISGYIMAGICATNPSLFLRRRLIRIVPPYWALTGVLFLCALRLPHLLHVTRASGVELLKSLLFIPFFKADGTVQPLLFVGWSLNCEMFFYLAIALGLYLAPRRPMLCASVIVLGVIALCRPFRHAGAIPSFYSNVLMIDFLLGILAYHLCCRMAARTAFRMRWFWLAVLLCSTLGAVAFDGLTALTSAYRPWIFPLVNTAIVFSAVLLAKAGWDTRLGWVVLVGDSSYILYLVHPFCAGALSRALFRSIPALDITRPLGCSIACACSVLAAILIHRWIERPCATFLSRRLPKKPLTVSYPVEEAMPLRVA